MVPEPILFTIGDIGITEHWIVTPMGPYPIASSRWTSTPVVTIDRSIPTWAVVCAIVFFVFCLLGLLFLLAKENKTSGYYDVQVEAIGFHRSIRLPISSQAQVIYYDNLVAQARQLAYTASLGAGF